MAGLFTRLGGTAFPIEAMGYTVAKHGAVALTRAIRDSEPCLYQTEGIKAYAICPFFADTQLVREGSSGKDGIKALEKRLKKRVLTVNEVRFLATEYSNPYNNNSLSIIISFIIQLIRHSV